jgi:phosphinothricin acetyltransferase
VLGYAYASPYRARSAYRFSVEDSVYIAPEAIRRGVGRALLDAAECWARGRGYRLLTLNVFVGNTRAHGLYERAGYEPEQTRMIKVLGGQEVPGSWRSDV